MRVGVIGCGYWGAKHVRVLSGLSEVEQVVMIEPIPERAAALQATYPRAITASSLAEGLPLVSAVVIATPAHTHASLALAAIKAGKHVLVEKPMATSTHDAAHLAACAAERGVVLMVGHTFEHHAAVQELRHVIQSGAIGDLLHVNSTRLNLGLYQRDVNVVWDLAPHDVSIMNYLTGEIPEHVSCWGFRNVSSDVEDIAQLSLEYPSGISGLIQVSWLHPVKEREVTALGAKGMAIYDDLAPGHPIRILDKGAVNEGTVAGVKYWEGDVHMPLVGTAEALVTENRHFLHCAATGETPTTGALNGLAVTATLEAAQRSLVEQRPVGLAELLDGTLLGTDEIAVSGA